LPAALRRRRQSHLDEERAHDKELHGTAIEDQGKVWSPVIEHHDFVNHRQLEMRVRVIDRDAGVLGEKHAKKAERRGEVRGMGKAKRRSRECAEGVPEANAAGWDAKDRKTKQERGFCKG